MAHVHPQGHLRLPSVAAEVTLADQEPEEEPGREVIAGISGWVARIRGGYATGGVSAHVLAQPTFSRGSRLSALTIQHYS